MGSENYNRRKFFQKTLATSIGAVVAPGMLSADVSKTPEVQNSPKRPIEWRNKQSNISYRRLGRTGFMVSEIVLGTFAFNEASDLPVVEEAVERGVNYLDCAAAYSNGAVESTLGAYLKTPSNREKVFLTTKLSGYYNLLASYTNKIYNGLSEGKKEKLKKQAQELMHQRSIMAPGYHFTYFGGQEIQFEKTYLRHFILKEHGFRNEWKAEIKAQAHRLLDQSLGRLQTDHVDVLFCPHGIAMPELMDDEILVEFFDELKKSGKIRSSAVSFHNDVAGHLSKVIEVGHYDVAMFAYNIANHAALENLMYKANQADIGMVAMKVAKLFSLKQSPEWRLDKLDQVIPDQNLSKFAKSYLWALQNPNLSCCVSQMETSEILQDNLSVIGKKVDLKKA